MRAASPTSSSVSPPTTRVETMGKMIIGTFWAIGLVCGYVAVGFPTSKADMISPGRDYVVATVTYGKRNLF
jgi:hypothetical protein